MYKLSTSARIKIDWCPKDSPFDSFGDYCLENLAVKILRLTFSEPSVTLFCCVCMWDSTVRHDRGRLITPYSLSKIKIRMHFISKMFGGLKMYWAHTWEILLYRGILASWGHSWPWFLEDRELESTSWCSPKSCERQLERRKAEMYTKL